MTIVSVIAPSNIPDDEATYRVGFDMKTRSFVIVCDNVSVATVSPKNSIDLLNAVGVTNSHSVKVDSWGNLVVTSINMADLEAVEHVSGHKFESVVFPTTKEIPGITDEEIYKIAAANSGDGGYDLQVLEFARALLAMVKT